ncbi:small RNA degrading nuclease 3 [Striga asiatica]|uniref:Small RNA degrading nuclease 3 n=1 Tax=Striga asiatica TaxID=4170 RepID=A0A5A7PDQ4_STRAF|nr:small RNA degrading nuclease 3 [Striga asiatica]
MMEDFFTTATKEVLVEMVKLAQKREMAGSKGHWKDFLKFYDKKFGSSLSDPSRRSIDSLVAFLKTFEQDEDLKLFKKVSQCHSNRVEVEEFKKENPDLETAEQELVRLTLEHPLYPVEYSFPSYEEEWVVVKCSKKSKAKKFPELISIDCEMVLCEDGTEALVKVCAVDRNLQVKLDKVVNPNKAIADYRTDITGISAKDLDEVTVSLKDVQKSVKKLLSHGTILVGHSANNDLQALKVDHTRVIDTSYIFKHAKSNRKPSLSLLCKTKLGYELREKGKPHNCLDDACAAMKLVLARLEGKIDSVLITDEVKELDVTKLLVHRIPFTILSTDLKSMLPGDCTVEVKVGIKVKNTYTAFAIYKSRQEAIEAFENLEGDFGKDSYGRPQKLVNFELDSGENVTLCVCKTFGEDDVGQLSKKRLIEDESVGKSKKLKNEDSTNQCDTHLEEIKRLKKELKQRDQEISSLNKIVAALTRKQGL